MRARRGSSFGRLDQDPVKFGIDLVRVHYGGPMLSDNQRELIKSVLARNKYEEALELLIDGKSIVDDEVLRQFICISEDEYSKGEYDQAALIADLALCVSDQSTTETKIDLHIAAGNGFALSNNEQIGRRHYKQAIDIARSNKTFYKIPIALSNLGLLYREANQFSEAAEVFKEAVVLAQLTQRPESQTSPVFWNAFRFYAQSLRDMNIPDQEAVNRALGLVQADWLSYLCGCLGQTTGKDDDCSDMWIKAYSRYNIIIDVPDENLQDVIIELRNEVHQRAGTEPKVYRENTSVLVDRVIGNISVEPVFLMLESLENDLRGTSTLVHEFTHYWSMSGSLGGYFSALVTELFILETTLDQAFGIRRMSNVDGMIIADPTKLFQQGEGLSALRAFLNSQAKFQCLWELWQPWVEGLAIFSEVEFALSKEDDQMQPIAHLLLSLVATNRRGGETLNYTDEQRLAKVVGLQNLAREQRLHDGYLAAICFGASRPGNEDWYFAGYILLRALWSEWSERCPSFRESGRFLGVLFWLTHSALDDLLPDWSLQTADFCSQLIKNFCKFIDRLFDLPGDVLAQIDTHEKTTQLGDGKADLWHFFQTGNPYKRAPDLWGMRYEKLRLEFASTIFPTSPSEYSRLNYKVADELIKIMLSEDSLHLVSESDFEFRIDIAENMRLLIGVGKPSGAKRTSSLSIFLSQEEYDQMAAEISIKGSGTGKLYQFLRTAEHQELQRELRFITVLEYGSVLIIWDFIRPGCTEDQQTRKEKTKKLVQRFLSKEVIDARNRLSASIEGIEVDRKSLSQSLNGRFNLVQVTGPLLGLSDIEDQIRKFRNAVFTLYLSPLINGGETIVTELHKKRLNAVLPTEHLQRAQARAVFEELLRHPGGLRLSELCKYMKMSASELNDLIEAMRGVAIFAKDFSGHPARKNQQKCTRPLMPAAAPIRPRHLVSTQQGVET